MMPADDRQLLLCAACGRKLRLGASAAVVVDGKLGMYGPRCAQALEQKLQRTIPMILRTLVRDVDTAYDYPVHSVISAAAAPRVQVLAPASIWDAARSASLDLRLNGRFGDAAGFEVPRYGRTVRDGSVVRHIARRQDETEEWAERERQRRARQRPPKPTKKAKTRGRKLLELVGDNDGN